MVSSTNTITKFLESWFGIVNAHHYLFLALLGALTAGVCFLTDLCTVYLIDRKQSFWCLYLLNIVKLELVKFDTIGYHMRYLIYVLIVVVFMMIAVSMS